MKKLVLGAAAGSLLFAVPALAADLNQEPIPEAPYAAPASTAFDWTGAYVGAEGGYGFATRAKHGSAAGGDGFTGGAYAGYNYQIDPHWVVGGEGDFSSGPSDSATRWLGTARVRGGYAIDNLLIYATGGVAAGQGRINLGTGSDTATHLGLVAGAGVEAALTKNITARAEYLYVATDKQTYSSGGTTRKADLDGSMVRLGVGYKF
jgi:outer membrane immunogenic protein